VTKPHIIAEIKRTATANGGTPLGKERFFNATGIKENDWLGRYWVRWSDAIREAGYQPNKLQGAYEDSFLLGKLVQLVRELGHFPVKGEFLFKTRIDPKFPSHNVFARFGSKAQLAATALDYCKSRGDLEDVITICEPISKSSRLEVDENSRDIKDYGFVYLLKSGRFYKIGRSNAAGRRERELAIQLPEKAMTYT
jgi:hypothetical protein